MTTSCSISPALAVVALGDQSVTFSITRSGTVPAEMLLVGAMQTKGLTNNNNLRLADMEPALPSAEASKMVAVSLHMAARESDGTFGL